MKEQTTSKNTKAYASGPNFTTPLPLTLYVHLPWCIAKCPYCDFNSHALKETLPESAYIDTLINDLTADLPLVWGRPLQAIFIGGGTPSLFSPEAISRLLTTVKTLITCTPNMEITMEANPGAIEQQRFQEYYDAGINRLSLGIQSLQDEKLRALGRIHDAKTAMNAIESAIKAGFSNINVDMMFGLPNQTIDDALYDLKQALQYQSTHFSWYQLTLEPNTLFYQQPPALPPDDYIWDIQQAGIALLKEHSFQQYEVSAFAQPDRECQHNLNYWQFGDYLGIGAGAHSKITDITNHEVTRRMKYKHPKRYLTCKDNFIQSKNQLSSNDLGFEFMLNALRLNQPITKKLFEERTGLPLSSVQNEIKTATDRELLFVDENSLQTTELGKRYLNELLEIFLL